MAIRRGTHTTNFTVIPNELINDNSMSLEARALLILLVSKPEGWQVSNAGLVAMLADGPNPVGRDLVGRMLREVVEAGYMVRSQERLPDGTLGPTDYEVHSIRYGWDADQPLTAKPLTVQPLTAKPLQESNVLEPKKELSLKKKREAPQREPLLQAPTAQHRSMAASLHLDCEAEWQKYLDWMASTGKVHKDRTPGFRNWLARAAAFLPLNKQQVVQKTAAHMPAILPELVERTAIPESVHATLRKLTGHAR
jgi:hypothetical protein